MIAQTLQETVLLDLSQRLGRAINAQPFQCAMNAWRTLIAYPELFQAGGSLVEGWYVIETAQRVTMNEHVWCTLPDGLIVDPSVLLLVDAATPVFYYPGLTRTWAETEALENELFPHVRFDGQHGPDGLLHPGYKAARDAARRKVSALALRQDRPLKAMQFLTAQDQDAEPTLADTVLQVVGEPLNLALSLTTARTLQARPGHCWYNARAALLQMPARFFTAQYMEGWLVARYADVIHLLEHGWVQTAHEGIVDPTLVLDEEVAVTLEYLPGVCLSWDQIQQHQREALPLARTHHAWHTHLLAYQHACALALEKGEALAWQTGLPLLPRPGEVHTWSVSDAGVQHDEQHWAFPVPATPSAHDRALAPHSRATRLEPGC